MRRRRSGKGLSEEDQRLWASVARTAVPLRGKAVPPPEPAPPAPSSDTGAPRPPAATTAKPAPQPPRPGASGRQSAAELLSRAAGKGAPSGLAPATSKPSALPLLERPVRRKIARGRLPIEARLDLHDMTQDRARDALAGFLRQAQAVGMRHVLVITGRASVDGSRGVIRRMVPIWFASAQFAGLVSGFESAERHHGGAGALYVRIRRPR